jgi:hypothetical protein
VEVFDDLAFVPDVISGGHHVNAQIEKLFRQRRRDSEARGSIFAVGDDEIDSVPLAQFWQALSYDRPPGASKNVTDKKNFQDQVSGLRCQVSGKAARGQAHANVRCYHAENWPLATGYWLLISAVFRKS